MDQRRQMEYCNDAVLETKHEDNHEPLEHGRSVPLTRKLDRHLKSTPVVSFGVTLTISWVGVATSFQGGLYNGGPSSLIWGFFLAGPGTAMLVLSLAEMSSNDPTVGAQYRWAAVHCPSFLPRRFVSFLQGWLTVFAWIANATVLPFAIGSQILGLVVLNYPSYSAKAKGWHTTLVGFAIIAIPLLFNIFARRTLKAIEVIGILLTFTFCVVFVVVLICLGGRNSAEYVFFGDSGGVSGWTNPTAQWLIGLLTVVYPITGFDAVLHLSDEVQNPERRIPQTMVTSWLINVISAFCFTIILLFFMGDPNAALNTPTGWPIIEICYQAARNLNGATALMSMISTLGFVSYFNTMVSVSRLTWAFARDDGLPFSDFFKVVHPTLRMPLRALGLTTFITMLFLLIPIGSTTAFNAILSITAAALFISYTLPCLFLFLKRISGEDVQAGKSKWSLGGWGIWANGIGAVWGIFISVWLCFPSERPVTAKNMNWAGPIIGGIVLFSLVDWLFRGRYRFAVPLSEKGEGE